MKESKIDTSDSNPPLIHLSREQINELPVGCYRGDVCLVRSDEDLKKVLSDLKKEKILGFDTETRPSFKKGKSYLPALLQLATQKKVYLFQLKHLSFPNPLIKILGNPKVVKVGVALEFDIKELQKIYPFEAAGFVELGKLATEYGIANNGLRGLAASVLGFRISKAAKTSNWDRDALTKTQIRYAATDAWVSREIYMALVHKVKGKG